MLLSLGTLSEATGTHYNIKTVGFCLIDVYLLEMLQQI